MKQLCRVVLLVALLCSLSLSSNAVVSTPSIFGDHMVLQQKQKLPVWGKADPGEAVTVTLHKQSKSTVADAEGLWQVELSRMKQGGPYALTIAGPDNTLQFEDVLIGEVWIGSGQSNMQWAVKDSNDAENEIAQADYPNIRLFSVKRAASPEIQFDCEGSWSICSPESLPEFSAVLYYFGRELYQRLNQRPVGVIHTSWGGTPAESWTSRTTLENDPELAHIVQNWDQILEDYPAAKEAYDQSVVEWEEAVKKAEADGTDKPKKPNAPRGPEHPWLAAGLYNAMIAPLIPYAIKGAIWYQGESNADRAYQYRNLFPTMITNWREDWGQGNFPFYFVQLANFTEVRPEPDESDWAELREAQTMTLDLKKTGMAVIIDIGEAKDIHPRNKQDVGKRLALNALAKDYRQQVVWSGPMYRSMRIWKDKAILSFNHINGGLTTSDGEAPKGFAIAGADKKFVWADAVIKGNKVIVSSPEVAEPVAVRYAWAHNPICNLINGKLLPASPFRTDDWPGLTVDKK
ncbi:MAG: sialate O-acetylesterase [Candidatus Hydrogenedentes bacterium]|nr:sialate O-acetylesterase [Candidatus Hydrogenedentota bacterium]